MYVDDTQIYIAVSPKNYSSIDSLRQCIKQISTWMHHNFPQLNEDETEVIVSGAKEERRKVCVNLNSLLLKSKTHVSNLNVILESDLHFSAHINSITNQPPTIFKISQTSET